LNDDCALSRIEWSRVFTTSVWGTAACHRILRHYKQSGRDRAIRGFCASTEVITGGRSSAQQADILAAEESSGVSYCTFPPGFPAHSSQGQLPAVRSGLCRRSRVAEFDAIPACAHRRRRSHAIGLLRQPMPSLSDLQDRDPDNCGHDSLSGRIPACDVAQECAVWSHDSVWSPLLFAGIEACHVTGVYVGYRANLAWNVDTSAFSLQQRRSKSI
jgi:hypothetical protein